MEEEPFKTESVATFTDQQLCYQFDCPISIPHVLNGGKDLMFILFLNDYLPADHCTLRVNYNTHLLKSRSSATDSPSSGSDRSCPPSLHSDPDLSEHVHVPLFSQCRPPQEQSHSSEPTRYAFHGMYSITSVKSLKPGTPAVVHLLTSEDFTPKPESAHTFLANFGLQWAIVLVERENTDVNPMIPLRLDLYKSTHGIMNGVQDQITDRVHD